jgi:hypothetical protein
MFTSAILSGGRCRLHPAIQLSLEKDGCTGRVDPRTTIEKENPRGVLERHGAIGKRPLPVNYTGLKAGASKAS